jgi:hypothetical protein
MRRFRRSLSLIPLFNRMKQRYAWRPIGEVGLNLSPSTVEKSQWVARSTEP